MVHDMLYIIHCTTCIIYHTLHHHPSLMHHHPQWSWINVTYQHHKPSSHIITNPRFPLASPPTSHNKYHVTCAEEAALDLWVWWFCWHFYIFTSRNLRRCWGELPKCHVTIASHLNNKKIGRANKNIWNASAIVTRNHHTAAAKKKEN